MHETGLTPYIIALFKHQRITAVDPVVGAAKFQIPESWAREYLNRELERRGMRHEAKA